MQKHRSAPAHRRPSIAILGLVFAVAAFTSGCGASFAPPATASGFGVTSRGEGLVAVHGLGAHEGVWQGDVRLPVGANDDVSAGMVGHQFPGQSKESFTLGQIGWRHRFAPAEARLLPSAAMTLALGSGGHNRAWGDDIHQTLVGAAAVDLGVAFRVVPWLQVYAVARTQLGSGLSAPEGLDPIPSTVWLQGLVGARTDVGPAVVGLGFSAARFWNVDDSDTILGPTITVGWKP